jgi:hypothetical protein
MNNQKATRQIIAAAAILFAASGTVFANQAEPAPNETQLGVGTPRDQYPAPKSDNDPTPPPPAPAMPVLEGVSRQAGTGGEVAYGRAGVLELGGSAGFSAASNYTRFELSPSIGLFLVDNLELSLLTAFNYFNVASSSTAPGISATELKALIEPSFHIPFAQTAFGFVGLGAGVNYLTGHDAGFAVQPRIGANILVGRSGVLTPSFTVAYSTVEALRTEAGAVLAVQTSYGMNIGYTVMW